MHFITEQQLPKYLHNNKYHLATDTHWHEIPFPWTMRIISKGILVVNFNCEQKNRLLPPALSGLSTLEMRVGSAIYLTDFSSRTLSVPINQSVWFNALAVKIQLLLMEVKHRISYIPIKLGMKCLTSGI